MKGVAILVQFLFWQTAFAQSEIPVRYYPAPDIHKPIVLYISGDGGWNNFSSKLASSINDNGYRVVSLNAKSYFWNKKTAEQSARDINSYLVVKFGNLQSEKLILIGYSFGADVLPFITNSLPAEIQEKIIGLMLLAPSTSTDFEIHLTDLIGINNSRSHSVIDALNALKIPKTIAVFGSDDNSFPLNLVHLKNFVAITLPGDHHFEGNITELTKIMLTNF